MTNITSHLEEIVARLNNMPVLSGNIVDLCELVERQARS